MIEKLIKKAISYLGVCEPIGDDQFIEYYNKVAGTKFSLDVAWCAIFVTVIARMVNIATSIIPTFASCDLGKKWFEDHGRYEKAKAYGGSYTPKRGDIVFYSGKYTQNDSTHVGYVVEVAGGKIKAIEGNKSDAVGYRSIALSNVYIIGYGRVADFLEEKVNTGSAQPKDNAKTIWDYLMSFIGNAYGVAGLMGNLQAESGLSPINLENSKEAKYNLNDESYTAKVDNGTYTNFVRDSAGYGLAQWTFWTRKEALLNYVKSKKVSIGDLTAQLEFLQMELNGYKVVLDTLKKATSVREASDIVLTQFERPANMSEGVKVVRAGYGQSFYDKYAGGSAPVAPVAPVAPTTQTEAVKIDPAKELDSSARGGKRLHCTGNGVRIRSGAGTNKKILGSLNKGDEAMWYGYYTKTSDRTWYYVIAKGVKGFVASEYLS